MASAPSQRFQSKTVSSPRHVAVVPAGRVFAVWVRPDYGRTDRGSSHGTVAVIDADTGDLVWHQPVHSTAADGGGRAATTRCVSPATAPTWL
ncbi:PQQ enzyme-like repeat protein [Haloactinospora alba]|uniref:PQQ enzyme-like repeat protein n=1 Tax=Haloactinospora alba TaxID=405555 RepID=A0A543N9B0_9ACTN|nr:PQQ enzyme-like repeat protein [Haloactinospora alba]